MTRTADGYDAPGSCCENTWAVYRDLRRTARAREASITNAATAQQDGGTPTCRFGAPLVAAALQHLHVLTRGIDAANVTPSVLPDLPLQNSQFGRPVTIRSL